MRIVSSLKGKINFSISTILAMIIDVGTWNNIGYQRAYTGLYRRVRHPGNRIRH
ncbi:MAG: hypothetical protein ACM30F_06675 [Nitrospirota bacterium]|nr:hypothetical protein [Nitrospirota bacterium]